MRNLLKLIVIGSCVVAPAVVAGQAPQPRHLEVSFDEQGKVTVVAQGVSVREILAEWARKGGSQFVNLEKLTTPTLNYPLRFDNQPEIEVLQSLLASAAGIIVGPRLADSPGASRLGTVVILATSSPTASTGFAAATPGRQTAPPPLTPGSPADEMPPVRPATLTQDGAQPATPAPSQPNRPGVFSPVQIVPVTPVPATGRGGGGGTPPTTTGRGGGGGGGLLP